MPWSFPGIDYQVECLYTQHVGFDADVAQLTINPQLGNMPVVGTLTMWWNAETITLPNCEVDLGSIQFKQENLHVVLMVKDRRTWWLRAKAISGEYNTIRVNVPVIGRIKTLRQLGTILMTALGEASADVSALPTDVYPEVSWDCDEVVVVAQALFEKYGFSVALGFGSEPVKVVQIGVGATLPTDGRYIGSDTFDPRVKPRYVANCFEKSAAQVRFQLEAVGLEPDTGEWLPIDSLSYKPAAGWEVVSPESLSELIGVAADPAMKEALSFVRRAYRVKGFADGTWNKPDGSGALTGISDVLPLQNRVIDFEDIRPDYSRQPYRIYGKHLEREDEHAIPPVPAGTISDVDDRIHHASSYFDGENGLVIFREPMFYPDTNYFRPAELWLECLTGARDPVTFGWAHYEKIIEVDPTGIGYHNVKHEYRAETVITYSTGHVVASVATNQAALDAYAASVSAVIYAGYGATAGSHQVYAEPRLSLRCDGAIQQVQHIFTAGEMAHALNRTVASANYEFDRGIPSRSSRVAKLNSLAAPVTLRTVKRASVKKEDADD